MHILFHNGSNYNYHFIIKQLTEEFKKQFTCLFKNTEKYITFKVSIEREVTRIDKDREQIIKNKCYKLQFIDSVRFMARSLSNLLNKLSEVLHRIKCNFRHDGKNVNHVEIDLSIATVFLNTKILKII